MAHVSFCLTMIGGKKDCEWTGRAEIRNAELLSVGEARDAVTYFKLKTGNIWSLLVLTFTFTYPLTAGVLWIPQMTSQPVSSIFLCSPLRSGTWRTPGPSIPWCCLPTSSSVYLVFFLLSLCLARWFLPDEITGVMSIPLQFASLFGGEEVFVWSGCLLDLGTDFLVGNMAFSAATIHS